MTRAYEREITRESLERGSFRILARRFTCSKNTIMTVVHRITEQLPDSEAIVRRFHPVWSGVLVFDGKYVRVQAPRSFRRDGAIRFMNFMSWLCGIDYGTGDLPHYALADEESMIDLVLYFEKLKEIGYVLRVLVSDGNTDVERAARQVYGDDFLFQLCTRHFMEGLHRKAMELGAGTDRRVPTLILLIQRIIEVPTLEQSLAWFEKLKTWRIRTPAERMLTDDFKMHAESLTTHLRYPELHIPHTTNDIENLFRQLNLRLKSIVQFMHWRFAHHYLKAWALWRRFTPYTDCKGKRRYRNGKAPLVCAGSNIVDIDFLSL